MIHRSQSTRPYIRKAPALAWALPDLEQALPPLRTWRQALALAVPRGSVPSMGYFSEQLDWVAKGRPSCLRSVAAIALFLKETETLLFLTTPNSLTPITLSPSSKKGGVGWPSPGRML